MAVSCKNKKASLNDPVQKKILIYQPCNEIKAVSNLNKDVNFRQKIFVKVQNSSNNIVNYPGTPIYHTRSCTGNPGETYIPLGKEYDVPQPRTGYYGTNVLLETLECGWPVANYSHLRGGKIEYEAISTVVPQPNNIIFFQHDFITIYSEQCN